MIHRPTRRPRWAGAVLALLLAAAPAAGDWLVTREGARVETKGPWKVKGKLVVFTEKGGRLASLRLSEVDLGASENATRDAVAEAAKPKEEVAGQPARRKSVRVVTDADVGHVDDPAPDAAEGEGDKEKPKADSAAPAPETGNSVVVTNWKRFDLPGEEGVGITGELRNQGKDLATNVRVTVLLYDEAREVLGSDDAILGNGSNNALRPGGTLSFRIEFPGVFSYAKAEFNVTSMGLKVKPADPKAIEDGAPPPP
jgi:hypothetical protein